MSKGRRRQRRSSRPVRAGQPEPGSYESPDYGTPGSELPWHTYPRATAGRVISDLPDDVLGNLRAHNPGLVQRLADGLSPEELEREAETIGRAMEQAGAPPGAWTFSRGDPSYGTRVVAVERGKVPAAFQRRPAAAAISLETNLLGEWSAADDAKLPPSLQGKDPDEKVPVLVTTSEVIPDGAGDWLGRLRTSVRTASGNVWPEGANVWQNLRPGAEDAPAEDITGPVSDAPGDKLRRPFIGSRIPAPPVRTSWQAEDVLSRHAKLARRYQGQDRNTVDYLQHLLNASLESDPEQAMRMHWPVQAAGKRGITDARQMAALVSRGLREALTYQVTAPMVDMMWRSEEFAPGVHRLMEGEMPGAAGWAWLDDPWVIPVADGLLPVRAVSWDKTSVPGEVFGTPGAGYADAVRLVFWVHVPDVVALGYFAADDPRVANLEDELGDLIPHHISLLPFRYRFLLKEDHETESLSMVALVHSLWTFLGMELSAARTVRPASQSHRKNILRSIRHDKVHVITLRRISYISENGHGGHRHVNRTCKWWVDDFYRHIDPYRDEDDAGRPRRHEALPAAQASGVRSDDDGYDVCAICADRGQAVRVTLVHGHRRGPAYLPWKTPAKGRTVHRLSR